MKYEGKPIDTVKYKQVDIYSSSKGIYEYYAITPQNEEIRKNHNNFFLKLSKWSREQHIGEKLAEIFAKRCGFNACDVDLYKSERPYTEYWDYGAISYVEKSKYDQIRLPQIMIEDYRESVGEHPEAQWVYNVETIINAAFKRFTDAKRPYSEFLKFKQDFINMLVFDIKFTNADRGRDNWMLIENSLTGEIELYPMFDNAASLGFEEDKVPVEKDKLKYQEIIDKYDRSRKCSIITPSSEKECEVEEEYDSLLKYLLKEYPKQTQKALEAVFKVDRKFLEETLNQFERMSEDRKKFTLAVFAKRDEAVKEIYQEYNRENNHFRESND